MAELCFRIAEERDAEALERIEQSAWTAENSPQPGYTGPVFGKRLPFGDVVVALENERIVGYAAIGRRTPFASNRHIGSLRAIVVDRAARGGGVGARLLAAAEREAAQRGYQALRLTVFSTNVAALRLYERAGWVELGRLPGEFDMDGVLVDDVFLGKNLTDRKR